MHRLVHAFLVRLTLLMAVAVAHSALAQGVTGSALTGTVTKDKGGPVAGASILLRNPATGDSFHTVSNASGVYFVDNIPPGGPYTLTATAEGLQNAVVQDVQLALGQRLSLDIPMRAEFVEEIAVVAHIDANADKGRTGPSTTRKNAEIVALPLQGRNFTSLVATDPRVVLTGDGFSIAGQNSRFNNIQIDGGANNDLFGLAGNGTPGGNSGAKPISLEAVQEFVVQVAPFDVRQGNFAGGLVNAITKSGTNDFHGGLFGYYQNKAFTRTYDTPTSTGYRDTPFSYSDYNTTQFGAFVGGPIIKDKAHFFIATDLQVKQASLASPYFLTASNCADPSQAAACAADKASLGFNNDDVTRFRSILQTKWGITNVGDASSPSLGNPDRNLFVKVTSNQIPNSRLELSYNLVSAQQDILNHNPFGVSLFFLNGGFQLSSSGYGIANTTNTGRVKLTTNWDESAFSNEFLGGVSIVRDSRSLANAAPLILVKVSQVGVTTPSYLAAGAERFSQANALDQDVYQLQDNLTLAADQHRFTFGTSNEFFKFRNVFLQAALGAWAFDCLNTADCPHSLEAGLPSAYQRRFGLASQPEPGTARFNVNQFGFYVQDEYAASENFSLTGGVRVDIPFLSTPVTNPTVLNSPLAIDTSRVPSGNPLWSPRFGFNWDVLGNSDTIVRGGLGIFSGPPPYVFVSNAYAINGLSQVQLGCNLPRAVPPFNPDPKAAPTDCNGGTAIPATANAGEIDYFDRNTRYPQNLRGALGVDYRLPFFGLVATADLLYTEDINAFYTSDENLNLIGYDGDGRALYGTYAPNTSGGISSTPNRIDKTGIVTNAIKVFNRNGGKTASATIQLQKPFARRFGISVAYTYSQSRDRMSFTSSQALSNYRFAPVDGDLENRAVRPSAFDRPHKVTITGTAALPYGFGVGLSYVGLSGTPYTWVVNGDINGDGQATNDLPFIPANVNQITLQDPAQYADLDKFLNSQQCLKDAKGSMLQRGACRNPWNDYWDLRFTWTSPNWKGQRLEVQYDIFNVLNLLNSAWGHYNEVTIHETSDTQFLQAVGYDPVNRRPIYVFGFPPPISNTVYSPTRSRWRMQFGARYLF
jgi:hypothetical protein